MKGPSDGTGIHVRFKSVILWVRIPPWLPRVLGMICDNSLAGKVSPCQGEDREFESLLSLKTC